MKKHIALCGLLLALCSPILPADVSDEEVQALREQIRLLSERLDQLERAQQPGQSTEAKATGGEQDERVLDEKIDRAVARKVDEKTAASSWADHLRWSGDFRYRHESIDVEGRKVRKRDRVRARALLEADVSASMRVGFGLASGSDDPVSTNQTLGGGGSTKSVNLDLAYFEWSGIANTKVVGGKFTNQLVRVGGNELLWDGDWRPEGGSLSYDNGTLFAVGIGTWLESDSNKSQKEFSYGLQAGVKLPLGERFKLTAGAGYYQFDTTGKKTFFGDGDFFGNSFDPATLTYRYDYRDIEGFAELAFDLFDRPALVFVDYVKNQDADENDSGYAFGFKYGKAKSKDTWGVSYTYQKLEADAVLGLLTSSDYGGGGTDSKGSVFAAAYAFDDNWFFQATYFLNRIDLASGNPRDFDRLQLDLNFKFK